MSRTITLDKHEMVVDKQDFEYIKTTNKQLEDAIALIANRDGDYTQNIVYEALVETGYYEAEEN